MGKSLLLELWEIKQGVEKDMIPTSGNLPPNKLNFYTHTHTHTQAHTQTHASTHTDTRGRAHTR